MSIDGDWEVSMDTPMGEQRATLTLKTDGSTLSGKMSGAIGTEEFSDGTVDGNNLEWAIGISQPMPMTLTFKAAVDGDDLSGEVALGSFGTSTITGKRA